MLKAQRIAHTWAQRFGELRADSGERTGAGSCQAVDARVGFCPRAGWDPSGDMIKSLFQKPHSGLTLEEPLDWGRKNSWGTLWEALPGSGESPGGPGLRSGRWKRELDQSE